MRRLYFSLLLLTITMQSLCAQVLSPPFSPVLPKDTLYYASIHKYMSDTLIASISTDSIYLTTNGWEAYLTPGFNNNSTWGTCIDSTFLGYSIKQLHDSTLFYQQNGHQWLIRHQVSVGDTFIFGQVNNLRCHLICTKKQYAPWPYGTLDTIKTLTFWITDTTNQPVAHDLNKKTILLSRHHGLVKTYDFSLLPTQISRPIYQFGHEGEWGIQNFTAADVFDFNVGDVFHRSSRVGDIGQFSSTTKSIITILSKQVLNQGKTFSYQAHKISRSSYWSRYADTVIEAYSNKEVTLTYHLDDYQYLLPIPNQMDSSRKNAYSPIYGNVTGPYGYTKQVPDYFRDFENNCLFAWVGHGIFYTHSFAPGLGEVGWTESSYSYADMRLVYYKKGNTTWGTPLQIDPLGKEPAVNGQPCLTVNWDRQSGQLQLTNRSTTHQPYHVLQVNGATIGDGVLAPKSTKISSLGHLPSGLYIISFPSCHQSKKIIVQ